MTWWKTQYWSRWMSLTAALIISLTAGSGYAFGIYSDQLKKELNLDQTSISLVASIANIGLYMGVLTGLYYERVGPRITVLTGDACIITGFGTVYALITKRITFESSNQVLILLCAASWFAQLGSACLASACVTTCVRNLPHQQHGQAVGLLKGTFGLSSSLFSIFYVNLTNHDVPDFLIFMCIFIPCISTVVVVLNIIPVEMVPLWTDKAWHDIESDPDITPLSHSHDNTKQTFPLLRWLIACSILATYLITMSIIQHSLETSMSVHLIIITIAALLILSLFIFPFQMGHVLIPRDAYTRLIHVQHDTETHITSSHVHNSPLRQTLRRPLFYALFLAFMVLAGSGLSVINNMTALVHSVTPNKNADLHVALLGGGNFAGRVIAGFLSDRVAQHGITRPMFLIVYALMIAGAMLVLALTNAIGLYVGVTIVGFAYGGVFTSMSSIAADLFGPKHHASNYGAFDVAPIFGSFLFSTFLVNVWYDDDLDTDCVGRSCFRNAYLISAGCSILAAFLLAAISRSTYTFYKLRNSGHVELDQDASQTLPHFPPEHEEEEEEKVDLLTHEQPVDPIPIPIPIPQQLLVAAPSSLA